MFVGFFLMMRNNNSGKDGDNDYSYKHNDVAIQSEKKTGSLNCCYQQLKYKKRMMTMIWLVMDAIE